MAASLILQRMHSRRQDVAKALNGPFHLELSPAPLPRHCPTATQTPRAPFQTELGPIHRASFTSLQERPWHSPAVTAPRQSRATTHPKDAPARSHHSRYDHSQSCSRGQLLRTSSASHRQSRPGSPTLQSARHAATRFRKQPALLCVSMLLKRLSAGRAYPMYEPMSSAVL